MSYKPKIVTGKVKGTGWPIDGHVLYFGLWDYDNHSSWHLYSWDDADDEAVMLTMYQSMEAADFIEPDTLEDFTAAWKAGEWDPPGSFCLALDQVEVLEVVQEEEKSGKLHNTTTDPEKCRSCPDKAPKSSLAPVADYLDDCDEKEFSGLLEDD